MTIYVLGTEYKCCDVDYKDNPAFEKMMCDGYTNAIAKEIVLCKIGTHPLHADCSTEEQEKLRKEVLRHEIVHAFLNESGLRYSANGAECWPVNEEMVDWIALQGPKIYAAWEMAGAL